MNKNQLYNIIMRNISKEIKYALNEEIQKFDVTEYDNSESDLINTQEIDNLTYKYFPENKQELQNLIAQKIKENKFGNKSFYYPDLSDIDISKITNMRYLFHEPLGRLKKPIKLDLSNWKTHNVRNMTMLFEDCETITDINISTWNTSNVEDMSNMFSRCKSLKTIDLSNFDTSHVTDMSYMFSCCFSLNSLDLSNFDTSNVTRMCGMFHYCKNLTDLDISHFNIENIQDYNDMFEDCENLENLKLFNISNEMLINAFDKYIGLK